MRRILTAADEGYFDGHFERLFYFILIERVEVRLLRLGEGIGINLCGPPQAGACPF
jgi:hypothetical protein